VAKKKGQACRKARRWSKYGRKGKGRKGKGTKGKGRMVVSASEANRGRDTSKYSELYLRICVTELCCRRNNKFTFVTSEQKVTIANPVQKYTRTEQTEPTKRVTAPTSVSVISGITHHPNHLQVNLYICG
jgi:hypothetical protein